MNLYQITFITLDGNPNTVVVDAENKKAALKIFENDYSYESIELVEEL